MEEYFRSLSELISDVAISNREEHDFGLEEGIQKAVDMVTKTATQNKKVILIGNGGSAAIVSHMQNDLCGAAGIRAMVFNEPSLLTALTNDYGYESAFEKLIHLWGDEGDLLIAVSSSGKSQNILIAVQAAIEKKCKTLTFSGFREGNPLRTLGDLNFYIPAESYGFVEVAHMSLMHAITDLTILCRLEERKPLES